MSASFSTRRALIAGAAAGAAFPALGPGLARGQGAPIGLLNLSYDPTRELYGELNAAYTDEIATRGKLMPDNQPSRRPNSTPYTSTIIFLVRRGNPWRIRDWPDLVKSGIGVIAPNPKTSGGARWGYMAAWNHGVKQGGDAAARAYLRRLFGNVAVLDSGAPGATITFAERKIGDVLLSWENEAYLTLDEFGADFDIVYPSSSILAEPPVALVDPYKTGVQGEGYLSFLFRPAAQAIIAKHHFRPRNVEIAARYANKFKQIPLANIAHFGGWRKVQALHFADGGVFDQIYQPG